MDNETKLLHLMEMSKYPIVQENGQCRYGPPPDWVGLLPEKGCEAFVGKICRDLFEDELVPGFSKIGKIYMLRLMMDFSGSNRGYYFITYTCREHAQMAIQFYNNYEIRHGRFLGVCTSVDNCKLFVGGIPKDKVKDEIIEAMREVTDGVKDVIVYSNHHDKSKNRGFAFVEHETHRAAAMARRKLIPGSIQLFNHQIAVDWAEPEVKVLHVRNLSLVTSEDTLRDLFTRVAVGERGMVSGAHVIERVKKVNDFAFVHFTTRDSMRALSTILGAKIDGVTVEVSLSHPVDRSTYKRHTRCEPAPLPPQYSTLHTNQPHQQADTEFVDVQWLARYTPVLDPDTKVVVNTQPPSTAIKGNDITRLKKLDLFSACAVQIGDRGYYNLKQSDLTNLTTVAKNHSFTSVFNLPTAGSNGTDTGHSKKHKHITIDQSSRKSSSTESRGSASRKTSQLVTVVVAANKKNSGDLQEDVVLLQQQQQQQQQQHEPQEHQQQQEQLLQQELEEQPQQEEEKQKQQQQLPVDEAKLGSADDVVVNDERHVLSSSDHSLNYLKDDISALANTTEVPESSDPISAATEETHKSMVSNARTRSAAYKSHVHHVGGTKKRVHAGKYQTKATKETLRDACLQTSSSLRAGDRVAVEIIHTCTTVDVMWQQGDGPQGRALVSGYLQRSQLSPQPALSAAARPPTAAGLMNNMTAVAAAAGLLKYLPPRVSSAAIQSWQTPSVRLLREAMSFIKSLLCMTVVCLLMNVAHCAIKDNGKESIGTVIGIDLGTTYSCVGVYVHDHVEIIANDQGSRITPSYVSFTPSGDRLIGQSAINQVTTNSHNSVYDVKRLIGRTFDDPSVQEDMQYWPFKVVNKGNKPNIQVQVGSEMKTFAPEEISAMVLSKMKEVAEAYLGKKVTHAVVTVPAYFNDAQRRATKDAGVISGLTILHIINEPTAAALGYGMNKMGGEKKVLVYDLGGGTFDVTLLKVKNGEFRVLATNGDTHLGGEDFDQRVMDYFIKLFRTKTGKDIRASMRSVQRLRLEVERAKRFLSSDYEIKIEIESLVNGKDFSEVLTRAKFESLCLDLFQSTLIPLQKVLEDGGLTKKEVDEVVLVGGSTRILKIQQMVSSFFDGKELSRSLNPDEAVAYGAALQAGVLGGQKVKGFTNLIDVIPLTLGVESDGGLMNRIIERNSVIPTEKTRLYSTSNDNQETVSIWVYEGERLVSADNHLLGKVVLSGILPAPRGVPRIQVTFQIDRNGILTVSATDAETGNAVVDVIDGSYNSLSSDEVNRMINDAEKFHEADELAYERLLARNKYESYLYFIKKQVKDPNNLGGMLSRSDYNKIQITVDEHQKWLDSNPMAEKDECIKRLKMVRKLMLKIYHTYSLEFAFNIDLDEDYAKDEL